MVWIVIECYLIASAAAYVGAANAWSSIATLVSATVLATLWAFLRIR